MKGSLRAKKNHCALSHRTELEGHGGSRSLPAASATSGHSASGLYSMCTRRAAWAWHFYVKLGALALADGTQIDEWVIGVRGRRWACVDRAYVALMCNVL